MADLIHHTFAPHVDRKYLLESLKLLVTPWRWQQGSAGKELAQELQRHFGGSATLYYSGRQGLLALLRSLLAPHGSEVIIPAFTCVALPNAIKAAGLTPVYCDIEKDSLGLDPAKLKEAITDKTVMVIVQHTFGIPSQLQAIADICKECDIVLLEDCAHILPSTIEPGGIGSLGDAVLLSFGRDKAISGIGGGAIICRKINLCEHLGLNMIPAKYTPYHQIGRLLLYPAIYSLSKPFIKQKIGLAILRFSRILGLLIPVTTKQEKAGKMSHEIGLQPNAFSALALKAFRNLKNLNFLRQSVTNLYLKRIKNNRWEVLASIRPDMPLQKLPLYVKQPDIERALFKAKNIFLDDGWTGAVVCPRSCDQQAAMYTPGSCPVAEEVSQTVCCLPTHPTMTEALAEKLISELSA